MRYILKTKRSVFLNGLRSLSQTCGLASKGRATGGSTMLTQSPCSPVGLWKHGLVLRLTTAVDYRVPQMLYSLGCLKYSPRLDSHIRELRPINSGDTWEIELRGRFSLYFLLKLLFSLSLISDSFYPVHSHPTVDHFCL